MVIRRLEQTYTLARASFILISFTLLSLSAALLYFITSIFEIESGKSGLFSLFWLIAQLKEFEKLMLTKYIQQREKRVNEAKFIKENDTLQTSMAWIRAGFILGFMLTIFMIIRHILIIRWYREVVQDDSNSSE